MDAISKERERTSLIDNETPVPTSRLNSPQNIKDGRLSKREDIEPSILIDVPTEKKSPPQNAEDTKKERGPIHLDLGWSSVETANYPHIRELLAEHKADRALELIDKMGPDYDDDLLSLRASANLLREDEDAFLVDLQRLQDRDTPDAIQQAQILQIRYDLEHGRLKNATKTVERLLERTDFSEGTRDATKRIALITYAMSGEREKLEARWHELEYSTKRNATLRAHIALRLRWEERYEKAWVDAKNGRVRDQKEKAVLEERLSFYAIVARIWRDLDVSRGFIQLDANIPVSTYQTHLDHLEECHRSFSDLPRFRDEALLALETRVEILGLLALHEKVIEDTHRILEHAKNHPFALARLAENALLNNDPEEALAYIERTNHELREGHGRLRQLEFQARAALDPTNSAVLAWQWHPRISFFEDPILIEAIEQVIHREERKTLPDETFAVSKEQRDAFKDTHVIALVAHHLRKGDVKAAKQLIKPEHEAGAGAAVVLASLFSSAKEDEIAVRLYQGWCEGRTFTPPGILIEWAKSLEYTERNEQAFKTIEGIDTFDKRLDHEARVQLLRTRARLAHKLTRWHESAAVVSVLSTLDTLSMTYHIILVEACYFLGQQTECLNAITHADRALEDASKDDWIASLINFAQIEFEFQEPERALERLFTISFEIDATHPEWMRLCLIYMQAYQKSPITSPLPSVPVASFSGEYVVTAMTVDHSERQQFWVSRSLTSPSPELPSLSLERLDALEELQPGARFPHPTGDDKESEWEIREIVAKYKWRWNTLRETLLAAADDPESGIELLDATTYEARERRTTRAIESRLRGEFLTPSEVSAYLKTSEAASLHWLLTRAPDRQRFAWTSVIDITPRRFESLQTQIQGDFVFSATSLLLLEYLDAWWALPYFQGDLYLCEDALADIRAILTNPADPHHGRFTAETLARVESSPLIKLQTPSTREYCEKRGIALIDDGGAPDDQGPYCFSLLHVISVLLQSQRGSAPLADEKGAQLCAQLWRARFMPPIWTHDALLELFIDPTESQNIDSLYLNICYFCTHRSNKTHNKTNTERFFADVIKAALHTPSPTHRRIIYDRSLRLMQIMTTTLGVADITLPGLKKAADDNDLSDICINVIKRVLDGRTLELPPTRLMHFAREWIVRLFAPHRTPLPSTKSSYAARQWEAMPKPNALCPCNSGTKYKHCCMVYRGVREAGIEGDFIRFIFEMRVWLMNAKEPVNMGLFARGHERGVRMLNHLPGDLIERISYPLVGPFERQEGETRIDHLVHLNALDFAELCDIALALSPEDDTWMRGLEHDPPEPRMRQLLLNHAKDHVISKGEQETTKQTDALVNYATHLIKTRDICDPPLEVFQWTPSSGEAS